VEFFRQTLYHSNLHQTSPNSQRLQTCSPPLAVYLVCRTWAMDFLHFQVSALAYPLFQKQQVCLESADFQMVSFQMVDCQDLAQAYLRYQQVFLELVGCQQVAYQALVPACLRYRQVFHSPAVLGQVCPHCLPVYLSLAECQLFQELADFQTAGCQASDLVCQRSQASDPVYLRCQQDFLLVAFQLVAFQLADFPLADFPLAAFPLADFPLVDFPLEVFQDSPTAVFLTAVSQLAVFQLLAQVFQLFQRQRIFCLELVGSQLVAFQRLVQGCRRVSQACRILRYQRQQTL
jgi:hypothetical protein